MLTIRTGTGPYSQLLCVNRLKMAKSKLKIDDRSSIRRIIEDFKKLKLSVRLFHAASFIVLFIAVFYTAVIIAGPYADSYFSIGGGQSVFEQNKLAFFASVIFCVVLTVIIAVIWAIFAICWLHYISGWAWSDAINIVVKNTYPLHWYKDQHEYT